MTIAATSVHRVRWYHGWNIVAVCVLSQVSSLALTVTCFSLFLNDWTHEFNVPVSVLAGAVTLFSLVSAGVAPVAGALADRFPARWLFGAGLLGLAAFHVAVGFVGAGWQILVLYSLMLPFCVGLSATITAQAVVSRWFVRRVGLAMGLTAFGLALAGVLFPSLIVWLLPLLGWRRVWWLFATLIALVILPLVIGVLRDRPSPEEGRDYVGVEAPRPAKRRIKVREVFARPNFWITVAVFVPVQCGVMAVTINLAPLVAHHGFSRTLAGLLLAVMSGSALCAKLCAGLLVDRLGNRVPLVLTGLFSACGVLTIALCGGQLPLLFAGMVLVGLSGCIWTVLASATAREFGAEGFGGAYGLISAFAPVGSMAAPIVARLEEHSGSYLAGLCGVAALAVAGAAVATRLKEKPRRVV